MLINYGYLLTQVSTQQTLSTETRCSLGSHCQRTSTHTFSPSTFFPSAPCLLGSILHCCPLGLLNRQLFTSPAISPSDPLWPFPLSTSLQLLSPSDPRFPHSLALWLIRFIPFSNLILHCHFLDFFFFSSLSLSSFPFLASFFGLP